MLHALGLVAGQYRLERELGRGTFGTVYAARRVSDGAPVALKLLSRFDEGASAERFRRETEILRRMPPHPHVVKVLDAGEHGSLPFVVMELVARGSLAAALERGEEPSVPDAVALVAKLASALEHVHGLGVVHRDVTAKNVLLDEKGEPRLTDFGLSLELDRATRLTETGELVGTFRAFAPEQLERGRAPVGPEADTYALAALLYRLVTGRSPFAGARTLRELEDLVRSGVPPAEQVNPRVPPALARVLERGLAFDPKDRPRPAGELGRLALAAVPVPATELPATIGAYRVLSVLGRGGMAVVYEAEAKDGARVAVKVLPGAPGDLALARFERERRLLASLGAVPGLVPILDAGESPRGPYIVLPLLPGGTLAERLGRGPLGVAETLALGRRVAGALAALHGAGIVHRDVKPSNILFDAKGDAWLVDLGLGKHFKADGRTESDRLSTGGGVRGTVGYMPAEQLEDASKVGPAADVFALGAVLHECLAGEPAFSAETIVALMQRVLAGPPPPLRTFRRDVPPALERAISRALATDPAARHADGEAFEAALEAAAVPAKRRLALLVAVVAASLALAAVVSMRGDAPERSGRLPAPPSPVLSTTASPSTRSGPPRPTAYTLGPVRILGRTGHAARVEHVAVAPEGSLVAFGAGAEVHVVDAATGAPRAVLANAKDIVGIAFLASSRLVTIDAESHDVLLWTLEDGAKRRAGLHFQPRCVAASDDGTTFATAGADRHVQVWDETPPRALDVPGTLRGLAFSGGLLVGAHKGTLYAFDPRTGEATKALATSYDSFSQVAVAAARPLVVAASAEGRRVVLADLEVPRVLAELARERDRARVLAVAVSRDARLVAVALGDGLLELLDARGERLAAIDLRPLLDKDRGLRGLAFDREGRAILGGAGSGRFVRVDINED